MGTDSRDQRTNFVKTFRKSSSDTSQQRLPQYFRQEANMIQQFHILIESLQNLRMMWYDPGKGNKWFRKGNYFAGIWSHGGLSHYRCEVSSLLIQELDCICLLRGLRYANQPHRRRNDKPGWPLIHQQQKIGLMWDPRSPFQDSPSWWGSPSCSPDQPAGKKGHLIRKSQQCSSGFSVKQNELSTLLLGIKARHFVMPLW